MSKSKSSYALKQLGRYTEEQFEVFDIAGKKLGQTNNFQAAMVMHIQSLNRIRDKRPELWDNYAGVSERPDSFGHPLFYLY